MKRLFLVIILLITINANSQCSKYYIYETFSPTLPTEQGTWIGTSLSVGSTAATIRTGTHYLIFNALNDAIRLPIVANPGVLSFYYRRSSTGTGTPKFVVQTSTNGTTWTDRLTLTTFTTSYVLASIDLGALSLTNVHIRIIDLRLSGTAERYIDDLSLTSTSSIENTLLPILSTSCSQTIVGGEFINIVDNGGPSNIGGYSNGVNRTVTITPSDNTKKVILNFLQMDLELGYDSLYVYDGPNTSSNRIISSSGSVLPSSVTSSGPNGELTIQWKTDVSNIGIWGGFLVEASIITPLPVELIEFEGYPYQQWNVIKWSTASEHNSSYFDLELSLDGFIWETISTKEAAYNSNTETKYSYIDFNLNELTYYRLSQYDTDGQFKIYGPISVYKQIKDKKIVKYINLLGQEVNQQTKGLLLEIYDDGTIRKIIN